MKFLVTLDRDEDGVYVIECPSIPGCISQGDTRDEAIENIKDAIKGCLEVRAERGMPMVSYTAEVEVRSGDLPDLAGLLGRPSTAGKAYTWEEVRAILD